MTMPAKIKRDPVKRREYLFNLCGSVDGQTPLIKAIIYDGSTCGPLCPNFQFCKTTGKPMGGIIEGNERKQQERLDLWKPRGDGKP